MRDMAIVLTALATLSLSSFSTHAQYVGGSWCVRYGTGHGGTNCGLYSFEQCMAALSGNGGHCARNQWYTGGDRGSRRREQD